MEYNSLKTIGKIRGFDGEAGTIISQNAEFIFNLQNVKNPDNIQDSTFVSFYPSTVKFGNEIHNIAREVEALTKDEIKKLQK